MKKVAITGGIGSGKSFISNKFAKLGVPIYNSDVRANIIINSNITVKKLLIKNFGNDCYIGEELNKKLISKIIFNNKSKLRLINSIVHPFVNLDYNSWLQNQKATYTIYESAIIYENNSIDKFDKIIGVISDTELKISRLFERGMKRESINNITDEVARVHSNILDN